MDIDGLLHLLGTMYRWYVVAFSSGVWNIPTPVDQVLDCHVIQIHIKIYAFCEQWWQPKQHLGKKSRHMLHLLCQQGPLGTVLAAGHRSCMPLARLPLTPLWCLERIDRRMEWRFIVFTDESRFCLYASDGHTCVRVDLECMHSPMTHRPHVRLHSVGVHQLQLLVTFGVSAG